ncbi:leucine-rich repeat domain-containing protein [Treponema socranskii]|uniref:leucine-rich repeat domain-containing protein n=1 Tax=Treponema socranskii TaxID=53419 RepID=UPI003D6EEC73
MNKTKSSPYICIGGGELGKTLLKKIPIRAIGALLFAAALVFTSCSNDSDSQSPQAPFVEEGASLILSPDKPNIKVKVTTFNSSAVTVEGCDKTTLTSGTETDLHASGTTVILKGKITELNCFNNQLTALNVQGCTDLKTLNCSNNRFAALDLHNLTALQTLSCFKNQLTALNVQGCIVLQTLDCCENQLAALNVQGCPALQDLTCYGNQLNANAFEKIFDDLPTREASDDAGCYLYTEQSDITEGNHKNFTAPEALKTAFENARNDKKWTMYKYDADGNEQDI